MFKFLKRYQKNNNELPGLILGNEVTITALTVIAGEMYHLSIRYHVDKDEEGKLVNVRPAKIDIDGGSATWSNLAMWDRYLSDEEIAKHIVAWRNTLKEP